MNKSKITFGKIQLNVAKKNDAAEEQKDIGPEVPAEIASTSGKRSSIWNDFNTNNKCFFFLFLIHSLRVRPIWESR